MNTISSNQNTIIKEINSLKKKKFREEKKLFFIEGLRFVDEALKENVEILRVLVSEQFVSSKNSDTILGKVKKKNIDLFLVTDKIFNEISDTEAPQGILAVVRMKSHTIDEILTPDSFIIVLDSVQDPGNLGTIIRTADAANSSGILLSKGCVDAYNPKVLRSTMGSIFHIPHVFSENIAEDLKGLKNRGIQVLAAHLEGKRFHFETDLKQSTAVIIGNEANGISEDIIRFADELVRIPMPGKAESLNASVAAGVLMFEVVRQRTSL